MPKHPENHRKHWSETDDDYLQYYWGEQSVVAIAAHLKRTPWSVLIRGAKHLKLGPMYRGSWSLRALAKHSGFSIEKVNSAIKKLGMVVRRSHAGVEALKGKKRSRRRALTDDQVDTLINYMLEHPQIYGDEPGAKRTTNGAWGVGTKPPSCVKCGGTDRPHEARGLCTRCYMAPYRKTHVKSSGPRGGGKRLTDDEVRQIRQLRHDTKMPLDKIAAQFGVTRQAIGYIVNGRFRLDAGGPIEE